MLLAASGVAAFSAALSGCPAASALPPPPPNRPTYALTVTIASNRKAVRGTSRISFAPEHPTDRIVLRLWPNIPAQRQVGARLVVRNLRVGGAAVPTSAPDPTTLVIGRPVAAGERVVMTMTWVLTLPRMPTERLASRFGVRLSSFFPLLAWDGREWALDPPAPQLETWTTPVADFDVKIAAPKGMQVFASGAGVGNGRWRAVAVRDFAIEAGRFAVVRRVVRVPSPVVLKVVAASTLGLVPSAFVNAAVDALTTFSQRYGPYPWSTFTVVVEADRPELGEEYPTIVFVSPDLGADVVTHETAHQWFYSLVGDNPARDPWLDESLAQWATARVWDDVENEASTETPAEVRNRLGEPMTFWGPLPFMPTVWAGLYLQGVKALAAFGDPDGVDCALQRYVHDNAYRIARPPDLLAALRPTFPDAEAILTGFGARF
jgi:hypothetical protein